MKLEIPAIIFAATLGVIGGCTIGRETAPQPEPDLAADLAAALAVDPKEIIGAIVNFDCDQMIAVTYFSRNGGAETIRIHGSAMLFDEQLHLSHLPYESVNYFINQRPCGLDLGGVQ